MQEAQKIENLRKQMLEERTKQNNLLDHFAGLAMQAMIASGQYDLTDKELAYHSYKKANEMINQREDWIDE